jgi:L-ascorbate metabolism protein UlaG (beta-lactamase superfamily)
VASNRTVRSTFRQHSAAHLTWLGHSTVLVDLDGARLLTDPVLRNRVAHLRRRGRVDPAQYTNIDAVLVSHLHFDHLDLPSLEQLGHGMQLIVPRGGGGLLRQRGFRRVAEVEAGEEIQIGALTVCPTYAEHNGLRLPFFGARAHTLGYTITGGCRIYFAGDTELFSGMAEIGRGLDIALVPIWGWGPSAGPGHLDPRRAAEALRLLRPLLAVPIHWGTYAPLGFGRLQTALLADPVTEFCRYAAELAPEVDVHVLGLGGTLRLDAITDGDPS